jgi:nucleotide-binding universal stress UspA family protein
MTEILVAIDGSEHSGKVVEAAVKLAKETHNKILLMHVVPRVIPPEEFFIYVEKEKVDVDPVNKYWEHIGEEILDRFGRQIVSSGIEHEEILKLGDASGRIIDVVRTRKPAYVVIGLVGLHGLRRVAALGSVARRVIDNSPCPVLVVPV